LEKEKAKRKNHIMVQKEKLIQKLSSWYLSVDKLCQDLLPF
jgi:hypothetical protein